ncbi:unnamed protein product [Rhizophagus irregularis]|nr:unnamed protein product [Rhizophagus irregularis]
MTNNRVFRKNIFPSHFVNRQVRCLQSPSFMLRNSRSDLFHSSFSRNFSNVKDAESGHKVEAVIQDASKVPEEKLVTSLRELAQRKLFDILKKLKKDPGTPQSATSWKDLWIVIRDNWKQVLGIGILTDILLAFAVIKFSEYRVNLALETGTRPNPKVLEDELIPRPQISETLKKVFQPDERHSYYHVICGEHGTGKTTLTRMEARNVGKGVIYVDIPSDFDNLGEAFGKAINLSFFEDVSITTLLLRKFFSVIGSSSESAISLYKWRRVMKIFRHASEVYTKNKNKPPVIIYDNISRIVNENPKILDILQDDAKDNADQRTYIAVFVSSEGSVPRRMESRSAWSRAKKPVMEIGDLNKEESMEYLIKKRNIKEVDAKKIYDLVGGRIVDLKTVVDDFLAGQSFEVIKQQVLTEVEKKFQSAQLLPNDSHYNVGKSIISNLLKSKELTFLEFKKYFNKAYELNEVLGSNVFAYHPGKNTVTFQSQSIEYYIREYSDMFTK